MENKVDYRQYLYPARQIMRGYNYSPKIAAEIGGKILYLTEGEVRALQIMAKQKAEESDEAFEDFCKNVIVYSNFKKRTSKYKMVFQKNGLFEKDFECGFYSACVRMSLELL